MISAYPLSVVEAVNVDLDLLDVEVVVFNADPRHSSSFACVRNLRR